MTCSTMVPDESKRLLDVINADGFAARALDVIRQVSSAPDDTTVLELLHLAKAALGAEHAVFVSFIRDDDSRDNFRFLVAADPAWCLLYQQQDWYANDAWLLYAATHSEPVSDAAIAYRTKGQREARALAVRHGVASAYVVPAPASGGLSRLGVLILGSGQPSYFDCPAANIVKVFARSLAMELHEWWVRMSRKEIIERNRITADDLQLLVLERKGQTTKEIADQLGTTTSSVDSRFQRLNAKFHMPNRKATARLCAEYGLI